MQPGRSILQTIRSTSTKRKLKRGLTIHGFEANHENADSFSFFFFHDNISAYGRIEFAPRKFITLSWLLNTLNYPSRCSTENSLNAKLRKLLPSIVTRHQSSNGSILLEGLIRLIGEVAFSAYKHTRIIPSIVAYYDLLYAVIRENTVSGGKRAGKRSKLYPR